MKSASGTWTKVDLEQADINTILAALRFYQSESQGDPSFRSDWIQEIACPTEDDTSLDSDGIDELCERINCGEEIK